MDPSVVAPQVLLPRAAPPGRDPSRLLVWVVLDAIRVGAGGNDDTVLVVLVPGTLRDADVQAEGALAGPGGRGGGPQ